MHTNRNNYERDIKMVPLKHAHMIILNIIEEKIHRNKIKNTHRVKQKGQPKALRG